MLILYKFFQLARTALTKQQISRLRCATLEMTNLRPSQKNSLSFRPTKGSGGICFFIPCRVSFNDRLLRCPILRQVFPRRVHCFDQGDFLFASPFLQLLFPLDCRFDVRSFFKVNQPKNVVVTRESLRNLFPMLPSSSKKIAGNPDVKRTGLAGDDVDKIRFTHAARKADFSTSLRYARNDKFEITSKQSPSFRPA